MREIKFNFYNTRTGEYTLWNDSNVGLNFSAFYTHEHLRFLQYTGLKDKNGVEIYEGHILTAEEYPYQDEGAYNYHGVVEYAEEIAAFVVVKRLVNSKKRGVSDGMADYFEEIPFAVIGNIYENPELLNA